MPFQLKQVVPWGRSFEEYVAMFALSENDLRGHILGCGDGPASFNCDLTERGGSMISVDPIYELSADEISKRIDQTFNEIMAQTRANQHEFVWTHISSVEDLGRVRMAAMQRFRSDYKCGKRDGRYRHESLPSLSFPDGHFDLALCSHFLFLYSEKLDLQFHIQSIHEMCRVAKEVRIFPLLQLGAVASPHLPEVVARFENAGFEVIIVRVPYEFHRGGNQMLRIKRAGP